MPPITVTSYQPAWRRNISGATVICKEKATSKSWSISKGSGHPHPASIHLLFAFQPPTATKATGVPIVGDEGDQDPPSRGGGDGVGAGEGASTSCSSVPRFFPSLDLAITIWALRASCSRDFILPREQSRGGGEAEFTLWHLKSHMAKNQTLRSLAVCHVQLPLR